MNITTDGLYPLDTKSYKGSIVYPTGVDGGAVMVLSQAGGIPLVDGTMVIDAEYKVDHGVSKRIFVQVTGSTGTTDIDIAVHGWR